MRESSPMHLTGKAAVVTGSSHGIGRAVAGALAREGAGVVVNGRDPASVEPSVAAIRAAGGAAVGCAGSVADDGFAAALVDRCVSEFGGIDVLVNCAGIAEPPASSILDITPESWRELIDTHLTGTFNCCRRAVPHMRARRSGSIVNTSSHAWLGVYGGTGYPAAKGGTNSLTLALAAELRPHGVRVNAVCPGARTRLSSGPGYESHIAGLHARGLLDDALRDASLDPPPPEGVARLYAFLASDLAEGISGRIFSGAGGYVGVFPAANESLLAFRDHTSAGPWELDRLAEEIRKGLGL